MQNISATLGEMQNGLYERALKRLHDNTKVITSKEDFYDYFADGKPCGFALAHYNGSAEVEDMLRKDLKVTVRCIPFEGDKSEGTCIFTGQPSKQMVVFAKSY